MCEPSKKVFAKKKHKLDFVVSFHASFEDDGQSQHVHFLDLADLAAVSRCHE